MQWLLLREVRALELVCGVGLGAPLFQEGGAPGDGHWDSNQNDKNL